MYAYKSVVLYSHLRRIENEYTQPVSQLASQPARRLWCVSVWIDTVVAAAAVHANVLKHMPRTQKRVGILKNTQTNSEYGKPLANIACIVIR